MSEHVIVRHGKSRYNARETPSLDSEMVDDGIQQLMNAASLMALMPNIAEFDGDVSPYLRTLQSASIISDFTGVKFKVSLGPREIMTFYDYCRIGDYRERFPKFDWSDYPEGGVEVFKEETVDYMDRYEKYVDEIVDKKRIIVTHGIPVVTIMELLMGISRPPDMYHYVSNGSITHLRRGRLVLYNHTVRKES